MFNTVGSGVKGGGTPGYACYGARFSREAAERQPRGSREAAGRQPGGSREERGRGTPGYACYGAQSTRGTIPPFRASLARPRLPPLRGASFCAHRRACVWRCG